MKHVIYLLLVANVVYFSWNLLSGSNEVARALPPIPETAQRLVTLQEMQAAEVAEIEAATKAKPPGAGVTLGCQVLGPFLSVDDLQPLKERLGASGLSPRQQTREEESPAGYWVYLPAMEREVALEIRQTLDDASDSEYYIGKDNLLSLGTFREMSRAETRLESARKLGLEPTLEPRFKTRTTHWLELGAVDGNKDRVEGILQEFPGVELQAAACESIADTDAIQ